MNYDAMSYDKQLSETRRAHRKANDLKGAEYTSGFAKSDRIKPVITLVVYYGAEKWDGPRSLHEMMGEQDPEIMKFVQDYKLNLLIPNEVDDFEKFETEFGRFVEAVKCSKDRVALDVLLKTEPYQAMSDVAIAEAIAEFVGVKLDESHREGGKVNMCKAWEDQKKICIEEGREEGAIKKLAQLIDNGAIEADLLKVGYTREEIEKARKISC